MKVNSWRWWWWWHIGRGWRIWMGGCLVIIFLMLVWVKGTWIPVTTSPPHTSPYQVFNASWFLDSLSEPSLEPPHIFHQCESRAVDTLLVVPSAPSHTAAREGVRNSWGAVLPSTWRYVFYIGATRDKDVQVSVTQESRKHQDIIQDPSFLDYYANLTLKTLSLLSWVKKRCPRAEFLLKIDEDVYVNHHKLHLLTMCMSEARKNIYGRWKLEGDPKENIKTGAFVLDNLVGSKCSIDEITKDKTLESFNVNLHCRQLKPYQYINYFIDSSSHNYQSYVFGGHLYSGIEPDRNPKSKWYMGFDVFKPSTLPLFLSGTSYLMTTNLIPYLLDGARHTPAINLEDVYLSGLVAGERLKLKINHISGWGNFRPRWDDACTYESILTAHGLSPTELVDTVHRQGKQCPRQCDSFLAKAIVSLNSLVSFLMPRVPKNL